MKKHLLLSIFTFLLLSSAATISILHFKRFYALHYAKKTDALIGDSDFFYTSLLETEKLKDRIISSIFGYREDIENSNLPKYKFKFSDSLINYFQPFTKVKTYKNKPKDYLPARLIYKEKEFNIKIKLHGNWYGGDTLAPLSPHHSDQKKSYKIKIKKDNLDEVQVWNFIIPYDRFYLSTFFINQVYKKLGLPFLKSHFGIVYINDQYQGIYYIEEDADDSRNFYKKSGLNNQLTCRVKCDTCLRFNPNFALLNKEKIKIESGFKDTAIFKYIKNKLDSLILYPSEKLVEKYFHIDNTAKILAVVLMRGEFGVHDLMENNIRFTYDLNNQKFYITPRAESGIREMMCDEERILENCDYVKELLYFRYKPKVHKLFYYMFSNIKMNEAMSVQIKNLIMKNELVSNYEFYKDSLGVFLSKDTTQVTSLKMTEEIIKVQGQNLNNNLEILKRNFIN